MTRTRPRKADELDWRAQPAPSHRTDKRWPRDQVADDPLARPGVAFLGRAAVDETHVRRPVRRHDHVEEVEFQPAATAGCQRARRCQRCARSQGTMLRRLDVIRGDARIRLAKEACRALPPGSSRSCAAIARPGTEPARARAGKQAPRPAFGEEQVRSARPAVPAVVLARVRWQPMALFPDASCGYAPTARMLAIATSFIEGPQPIGPHAAARTPRR
jgi:hypothetical protein